MYIYIFLVPFLNIVIKHTVAWILLIRWWRSIRINAGNVGATMTNPIKMIVASDGLPTNIT